eukprot:5417988-Prymnesium_polylepis.1
MTRHNIAVDVRKHLSLGEGRRERTEVTLHAVDDEKRASSRVHRRDEQCVVQALHAQRLQIVEAAIVAVLSQDGDR